MPLAMLGDTSGGIRLEEVDEDVKELVHAVLKACLSPDGYRKALGCMLTNHFLGELVNGLKVLNKDSYNFRWVPYDCAKGSSELMFKGCSCPLKPAGLHSQSHGAGPFSVTTSA